LKQGVKSAPRLLKPSTTHLAAWRQPRKFARPRLPNRLEPASIFFRAILQIITVFCCMIVYNEAMPAARQKEVRSRKK